MRAVSGRAASRVFTGILFLALACTAHGDNNFATLVHDGTGVYWEMNLDPDLGVSLTVAGPDRDDAKTFGASEQPYYPTDGGSLTPGPYRYEMIVVPGSGGFTKRTGNSGPGTRGSAKTDSRFGAVQTGHFRVDAGGYVIDPNAVTEE